MFKTLKGAVSRAFGGDDTSTMDINRELDVIVRKAEFFEAGHEVAGHRFVKPGYHLVLESKQKPQAGVKSTFNAIIRSDLLDKQTRAALKPGAQLAVQGEPSGNTRYWNCAFIGGQNFDAPYYTLRSVREGKAQNPLHPSDVLIPVLAKNKVDAAPR